MAVSRETTAKRLTPTVTLNISEKSDFRVGKKSVKKHVSQVVQLPSLENRPRQLTHVVPAEEREASFLKRVCHPIRHESKGDHHKYTCIEDSHCDEPDRTVFGDSRGHTSSCDIPTH